MFAEEREEQASDTDADDQEAQPDQDEKPWYPYITKTQFEKFLSRLHGKIPEEIDRDYVRAIIRTPSMIYRFLRGIEAMKLIDHEQRPTERLAKLVEKETRRETLSDVVRDLYPELLKQWEGADGEMSDREVVSFFRKETGMGNDSANKMKMFFKYLLSESDFTPGEGGDTEAADAAPAAEETPAEEQPATKAETRKAAAEPAEAPADNGRNGGRERGGRAERRGSGRDRGDRSERNDRSDRGERSEKGERGGRDRDRDRGDRDRDGGFSNRPVTEAQRAYLDTLKAVLRVNVDGDWDDDMIRLAFDRLERIFDRVRRG
ncbi:MAG: DUF5343 domain-containing protein [Candidatus Latescibacteria bacterium]|jgi:hypothetical protein|nr:hypothetical protein [Gemmatimonadota bacterium]MDP7447838.1 DUF5343 domain-containing protein [Candidatus Latescibacterota bacterium]MDP7635324.1 DUF5343 domain-containing protein [Candidatus Latescibacterota bacterium]HJN28440.1 DUF5343 domain-containing protein [Candidatus Latescibacterota bacterium]|tara:strand:- start:1114 stop:2070 length:957 start_codon:yes stop_codon:yes gene_type:complete